DLVAQTSRPVTAETANAAFRAAAEGPLKGLLDYSEEPLVSMDFKGDDHSSIVDGALTLVTGDRLLKVVAWYDNEWGYSCRVADLAAFIGARL
ncbi:MAG: type I glyceraldehyde-3-phosphate dehydrogenase, partial [Candidatus Limnocylindria bacterium]